MRSATGSASRSWCATCWRPATTSREAREALARLPYSLSHNLTLVDRHGRVLTAYLSPDREPIFREFPAATNHQGIVEWPEQARATRTIERERCIVNLLDDPTLTADGFVDAFLRAPLFSTAYASGFGTLYTAAYRPAEGVVDFRWPAFTLAARLRRVRGDRAHRGAGRGLRRLRRRDGWFVRSPPPCHAGPEHLEREGSMDARPAAKASPVPMILGIVGGALLFIGSFLTWATVSIDVTKFAKRLGVDPALIQGAIGDTSQSFSGMHDGGDGIFTLIAGLVVIVSRGGAVRSRRT